MAESFFQGLREGALVEEARCHPVGFHGRIRQFLPGFQPFFRFIGADKRFRQEGADDGFLGFREAFGIQAFLKMLAGLQGEAVFQGLQPLLVFFIFQEGLVFR